MRRIAVLLCSSVLASSASVPPGLQLREASPTVLHVLYRPVFEAPVHGLPEFLSIAGTSLRGRSEAEQVVPVFEFPVTVPGPDAVAGIEVVQLVTQRRPGLPPTVEELVAHFGGAPPLGAVPEGWVEFSYAGIARGRHLGYVRIRCLRPLPEQRVTEVLHFLEIRLRFVPERARAPLRWEALQEPFPISVNDGTAPAWYAAAAPLLQRQTAPASWADFSSGTWLRVVVQQEGVYRITAEQLHQLGVRISREEIPTLKLLGIGGQPLPEAVSTALEEHLVEQPLIVRTTEAGELREILFYGAPTSGFRYQDSTFVHWLNPYTERTVYLLTWGGRPGSRAEPVPPPSDSPVLRPATYTARLFWEEELYQPFALPSGRDWFGPLLDPVTPVVYTTPLPDLERSGQILYRFVVVNRATVPAQFSVFEDANPLWSGTLGAAGSYTEAVATAPITVSLPAARIAGDNRSVLRFLYSTASGTGFGHVDWVEIHYPRRFVAINDAIDFFTEPDWEGVVEISITGFSGGEIWGFEVTDQRRPQLLPNLAISAGTFVLRAQLRRGEPRRFFISARLLTPTLERAVVAGLRERRTGAELLVLTPRDLLSSAEEYRRYREQTGISVLVVPTDAVFTEFAAGMPDPTALRNFLAFALATWTPAPRFVLLWGDGHNDYKGISTKVPNYVPTYQSELPRSGSSPLYYNAIDSYTTDDFYTWLQGEDALPDIALGRIPIGSDEEGRWMVEKLRHYETASAAGSWRTTVTLVADDGPTSSGTDYTLHTDQSEGLSAQLPAFLIQRKIYLAEYPAENVPGGRRKPEVTQDLVAAVNAGTLVLNWVGHGNPRLWAHEQILERETTIPLFQNLDRLFFLTAATCDFARFDNPQVPSGAEAMLLSRIGGAIGVFAATRLVYATPNAAIMRAFFRLLFQRQADSSWPRIGEVFWATKLQQFSPINDRKYALLGDPALRLLLPEGKGQVDSLNGVALADSLPALAAWSRVRLSGRILSPRGELWDDFSGRLFLVLTDAPRQVKVAEEYAGMVTIHRFLKQGAVLHQGVYAVRNGRWEAEFILPRELSFSDSAGRLFLVAFSEDGRAAAGVQYGIRFAGLLPSTVADTLGPRIVLYLDDPGFRPGDLVRSVPELVAELWDESGINTSGALGRRVEAWIDDDPTALDLTELVQPLPERPGVVGVRKPLVGLAPGVHRVRLRAWDVYGNPSTAETVFRIAAELRLEEPRVIPHPVSSFPVRFRFLFNGVQPTPAELTIADLLGSILVRRTVTLVPTRAGELLWDGTSDAGIPVAPGTYVYTLRLLTSEGTSVSQPFVIVR